VNVLSVGLGTHLRLYSPNDGNHGRVETDISIASCANLSLGIKSVCIIVIDCTYSWSMQYQHYYPSADGIWYIGVYSNISQSYGIWVDSSCPKKCSGNRGSCVEGYCACRYGWLGLDCNSYNGLSENLISVIILSVLVGLAACMTIGTALCFHTFSDDF